MKTYQVITNLSCNLRCTYCYEYLDNRKNNAESIINYLNAMIEKEGVDPSKELIIDFIGGEPFFVPEILEEVMDYVASNCRRWGYERFGFSFSSNGTLLHKTKRKALIERYKRHISIGVSIDGDKEKHDKHRLTIGGKGSFDSAIKGLETAIAILGPDRVSIKATFTRDSISDYARSLKYLYKHYGQVDCIQGNFNFEEKFDDYDGILIANEIMSLVRYLNSNHFNAQYLHTVNSDGSPCSLQHPNKIVKPKPISSNRCGSCTHMRSLGFNDKVYGCNRFCTMDKSGMELGVVKNGEFINLNNSVVKQVEEAYTQLPTACQQCRFNESCSDCVAIPIDEGITHKDYYKQHRMCGYTKAKNIAALYSSLLYNERYSRGLI